MLFAISTEWRKGVFLDILFPIYDLNYNVHKSEAAEMGLQTSGLACRASSSTRALDASNAKLGPAIAINKSMLIYLAMDQGTRCKRGPL